MAYRKNIGVNKQIILVGYLGSYAFYHDAIRLVLAATILKERGYDNKVKILMIGNGKEYKQCLSMAKKNKVLGNILEMKQAVTKEEVPKVLSAIDISVLPGSTDIISPIKVLEYMASETAVIAPNFLCNTEVITNGVDGILFEPENEVDLADKIEMLLLKPNLIKPLGEHAKQTVTSRFSWDNTWGQALDGVVQDLYI